MKLREELIAQVLKRLDVRDGSHLWTVIAAHVWHVFGVEHTDMPKGLWDDVVSRAVWLITRKKRTLSVRLAACRAFASVLQDSKSDDRLKTVPGIGRAVNCISEWAYYPDVITANMADDNRPLSGTKWCGS